MSNFQDTFFIYEHLSPIYAYVLVCLELISVHCCIPYRNQSPDCRANQMSGFYMKGHTGLKWVKCVPKFSLK